MLHLRSPHRRVLLITPPSLSSRALSRIHVLLLRYRRAAPSTWSNVWDDLTACSILLEDRRYFLSSTASSQCFQHDAPIFLPLLRAYRTYYLMDAISRFTPLGLLQWLTQSIWRIVALPSMSTALLACLFMLACAMLLWLAPTRRHLILYTHSLIFQKPCVLLSTIPQTSLAYHVHCLLLLPFVPRVLPLRATARSTWRMFQLVKTPLPMRSTLYCQSFRFRRKLRLPMLDCTHT